MIFVLQQIWPSIKSKISNHIDQVSTTQLGNEKSILLKSVLDDLEEKCVNKITQFQWPSEKEFSFDYEKNLKYEAKLTHEVVGEFLDIYSTIFDPFIGDVKFFSDERNPDSLPNSIKFRYYNIDLRHPKNNKPDFSKCNADNAYTLFKSNKNKTELMQGYWQTESMVREMRNHEEHWRRDGKSFLKTLKRSQIDPLSNAETTANVFTLSSSIILLSHHFVEILQTWLDTCKLLDQKA